MSTTTVNKSDILGVIFSTLQEGPEHDEARRALVALGAVVNASPTAFWGDKDLIALTGGLAGARAARIGEAAWPYASALALVLTSLGVKLPTGARGGRR